MTCHDAKILFSQTSIEKTLVNLGYNETSFTLEPLEKNALSMKEYQSIDAGKDVISSNADRSILIHCNTVFMAKRLFGRLKFDNISVEWADLTEKEHQSKFLSKAENPKRAINAAKIPEVLTQSLEDGEIDDEHSNVEKKSTPETRIAPRRSMVVARRIIMHSLGLKSNDIASVNTKSETTRTNEKLPKDGRQSNEEKAP